MSRTCNNLNCYLFIYLDEICGALLENAHEIDNKVIGIPLLNVLSQV